MLTGQSEKRTTQIGLGVAALIAVGLGFVLGFGFRNGGWSEITAAWVQAVGSIGAILFAWWQTNQGTRDARALFEAEQAERRRDAADRLQTYRVAAVSLVLVAAERVRKMVEALNDAATLDFALQSAPGAIMAAENSVGEFPAHEIGDRQGIVQFSHTLGLLDLSRRTVEQLVAAFGEDRAVGMRLLPAALGNLLGYADQLDAKANSLVEAFGLPGFD